MLITLMPISIAGWGVREATWAWPSDSPARTQRRRQHLAAVRRGLLHRRRGRRPGLDPQRGESRAGLGAARSAGVNPASDAVAIVPSLLAVGDRRADLGRRHLEQPSPAPALRAGAAQRAILASHPTPQGAGIAVISGDAAGRIRLGGLGQRRDPSALVIATIVIALVGFADDIVSLPVLVRLLLKQPASARSCSPRPRPRASCRRCRWRWSAASSCSPHLVREISSISWTGST